MFTLNSSAIQSLDVYFEESACAQKGTYADIYVRSTYDIGK